MDHQQLGAGGLVLLQSLGAEHGDELLGGRLALGLVALLSAGAHHLETLNQPVDVGVLQPGGEGSPLDVEQAVGHILQGGAPGARVLGVGHLHGDRSARGALERGVGLGGGPDVPVKLHALAVEIYIHRVLEIHGAALDAGNNHRVPRALSRVVEERTASGLTHDARRGGRRGQVEAQQVLTHRAPRRATQQRQVRGDIRLGGDSRQPDGGGGGGRRLGALGGLEQDEQVLVEALLPDGAHFLPFLRPVAPFTACTSARVARFRPRSSMASSVTGSQKCRQL